MDNELKTAQQIRIRFLKAMVTSDEMQGIDSIPLRLASMIPIVTR
jgi:hypothetical protein